MKGYRIFMIDDDARTVAMVKECLELGGYQVTAATSGGECLQLLSHQEADLIILDGNMPGIDGQQVLGRIREDRKHAELPVIILSAVDNPMVKTRCLDLGADDYVVKPFHHGEFMARIKAVLRRYHRVRAIDSAMSGQLSEVPLAILIQTMSLNGRTATISLADDNATIVLREGQVTHAGFRDFHGLDALARLYLGATGRFQIEFDQTPQEPASISQRTEHLMLNLAHQMDELGSAINPVPSLDTRLSLDSAGDVPEPLRSAFLAWQPITARRLLTIVTGDLKENAHMLALLYGLGSAIESKAKS